MRFFLVAVVTVLLSAAAAPPPARGASTLNRPADPVVLTGADVPSFAGIAPSSLVAFRYDAAWTQVPVQVDERAMKDFGAIYNSAPVNVSVLQYVDAGTFTGADPDPMLDANDEIAFMARDAGGIAPQVGAPTGTVPGTGVQVSISDPLAPGASGYVYLFEHDGSLSPGANQQYVDYDFVLLSGDYKTTYRLQDGPNPENSSIVSPYYARHFSDRWLDDRLTVTAGASTGADILDRHKALFAPGICGRSEDTFNDAEGAFVVNKSGPVRAIRSYIGANSGPLTQREHVFYEQRQDVRTFLRVHAIPSVLDFYDYSPAASGMTYYNNLNPGGVAVDGNPESPATGAIAWELVNGAQGAVVHSLSFSTDISGFSYTSYYLDDTTPPVTQCTGDAFAYGQSGPYVNQPIPNTDPQATPSNFLHTRRTMFYLPPGATTSDAQGLHAMSQTGLTAATSPWMADPDGDDDGLDDPADNCPTVSNAGQEDADSDALGDACETSVYGTNPAARDTDADGCADGREVRVLTFEPVVGGDRVPTDPWDFYDVTGDRFIDLGDTLLTLAHFGHGPAQDPTDDVLDRLTPWPAKPWRAAASNDGLDLQDALANLQSFGHDCSGSP